MSNQRKENILLIGNGPSIKDHELGELIDSYDKVVRFNWYHIDGYEKHVGTKTDIWFTTVADLVRAKEDHPLVYWHSWNWDVRSDKNYWKLHDIRKRTYPESVMPIKTVVDLVADMSTFMTKIRGKTRILNHSDATLQSWSSGAIAAWWFLNFKNKYPYPGVAHPRQESQVGVPQILYGYDQIHLYGFDWWDMDSNSQHHYGDSQTVGRNHSPQQEVEFFTYLWEMGKIHDLHPDSQFHHPPEPLDE